MKRLDGTLSLPAVLVPAPWPCGDPLEEEPVCDDRDAVGVHPLVHDLASLGSARSHVAVPDRALNHRAGKGPLGVKLRPNAVARAGPGARP